MVVKLIDAIIHIKNHYMLLWKGQLLMSHRYHYMLSWKGQLLMSHRYHYNSDINKSGKYYENEDITSVNEYKSFCKTDNWLTLVG